MTKEQLEKILNLDCRKEENEQKLKKMICNIKPLKKYREKEDVPMEAVERLVTAMVGKYAIGMQNLSMIVIQDGTSWFTLAVKNDLTFEWLGNVYGRNLKELWMKYAIKLHYEIKETDGIILREELNKQRAERRMKGGHDKG